MSIKDNLRAIAIIKGLQSEQRKPIKDELEILKEFNGWGAMWEVFKPDHPKHNELKFWLTSQEFEAANASILNAHYTHPEIVKAVWECVKHLGFKCGKVLEPSCGTGYFLSEQLDNDWTAVELDPIPSGYSKHTVGCSDLLGYFWLM